MDSEVWQATVRGDVKSQTQLSDQHTLTSVQHNFSTYPLPYESLVPFFTLLRKAKSMGEKFLVCMTEEMYSIQTSALLF